VDRWLNELFPTEDTEHQATLTRRRASRKIVVDLANHGRGNDGKTLWSWYNGYTEWMDGNLPVAARHGDVGAKDRFLDSNMRGARNEKRETARRQLVNLAEDAEILEPILIER
jgi:hypothetical protein